MTTIADELIILARQYEYYEKSLSKRLELKTKNVNRDLSALQEFKEATEVMENHIDSIRKSFNDFPSFNKVNDTFIH